jgi:hypothetical protein
LIIEYGILENQSVDSFVNLFKNLDESKVKEVENRLIDYLMATGESIGQIFDYHEGQVRQMNILGLLLEGALMRGEAIHDIGSECLVRYVLKNT